MNDTEIASWTDDGQPVDLNAICAICGWPYGKHRMMSSQCPVSEHHVEWRETKFQKQIEPTDDYGATPPIL